LAAPGRAETAPHDRGAFRIDRALRRVADAVRPYPKAALFELYEEGRLSALEQLVACILSIRTRDEVMLPAARRLLQAAPTAEALAALPVPTIGELIGSVAFHGRKAEQIQAIARRAVTDWDGQLPCDEATLLSLSGVGPKCANLVLGIACGQPRIGVDIHVHRITNRWGYVDAATPVDTLRALERKLPARHRIPINALLVPFGKHVCTGRLPRCSECPLLEMCARVGVTSHR
jgi:endonuclease III